MADLKVALEDLETETSGAPAQPSTASKSGSAGRPAAIRRIALFTAVTAAAVVMTFIAVRLLQRSPEVSPLRTVKFTFTPANLVRGSNHDIDAEVSISADGKHIAYVENPGGQLWIRDIDQEQARPVPGATGVYQAFWSPDNQSIGYLARGPDCASGAGCTLVRIPVQGGTPVPIVKLQGTFRRAAWSSDGETIVYGDSPTGLLTVPTRGGTPTRIIEHSHIEHPSFLDLPDGRRAVLYQAADREQPGHAIYVQVLGENRRRLIATSSSSNPYPAYSLTGHIIYVAGPDDSASIWAQPFSLATLEATGKAFPIVQHGSSPMVSRTGSLVYGDVPTNRYQLVWCDRSGKTLSTIGEPMRQESPLLSPDGHRLAVVGREGDFDLWVYELDRGIRSRITFDPAVEQLGAWTPSGDEITYAAATAESNGSPHLFSKSSSGSGEVKQLSSTALVEGAPDWSPDQRFLIYMALSPETKSDLLYRERHQDGTLGEPVVFLKTPFHETVPRFSPDGHFVVYRSDESGRAQIYVRDFPSGANKWQISNKGGNLPRWSRDGKEIFYLEQAKLMAVSVTTKPAFTSGTPVLLFARLGLQQLGYDVSADGKRIVVLEKPADDPPLAVHVVHNWFEEFRGQQQRQGQ